jgi:UDP-N-acetyl-D-mannosaminuronate dehydrogenase
MVETAEEINQAAPDYVASRIWQRLNKEKTAVNGASVLLLGVTYKDDISDVRESPAAPIASRLHSWNANIMYHDPFISAWGIGIEDFSLESVVDPYAAARDADIVVLLQNHSEYDLERFARCGTPLLDTRGLLPRSENVERL